MKSTIKNNPQKQSELIRVLSNKYISVPGVDSNDGVKHYLDVDEYEMAFEILFLHLMDANAEIDEIDRAVYLDLGLELGLDKHTVYDDDFWERLCSFLA